MQLSLSLRFIACMWVAALVLPILASAHPNHTSSMPDHPVGSPDYHEVTTNQVGQATEDTTRITLLLQLIELLRAQLAVLLGTDNKEIETDEVVACTMDALQCSDGSYVGRTGPNCEFVCPTGEAASDIDTTGDLTMTTDSTYRYFSSDGLPEYSISGNRYANTATAQDHEYRVLLNPELNSIPTYYNIPYTFGIALNGVTIEPFAAEWYQNDRDSGWQEDPFVTLRDLDEYNAHVQPSGLYHYHGQPTNLIDGTSSVHSPVIGFASDGFPLYGPYVYQDASDAGSDITKIDSSYELRSGTRSSGPGGTYDGTYNEDYEYIEWGDNALDECNGRYGVTPEYPDGTYYYVATESFPYIPRCLMGDQDSSFVHTPGPR